MLWTLTTRRLVKAGWASLFGMAGLLLPVISQAQQTRANNRGEPATARENAAIESLRPATTPPVAGEASNRRNADDRRAESPLANQEAQLAAARAEVRSLAAALEQANRRLADMERS